MGCHARFLDVCELIWCNLAAFGVIWLTQLDCPYYRKLHSKLHVAIQPLTTPQKDA